MGERTRVPDSDFIRPEGDNFRYLVRILARNLNAKVAFICELEEGGQRARTLALAVDGTFLDNLEYRLAGTPCEAVYREGSRYIAKDLAKAYPHDDLLVEWSVDSYLGVPFYDESGRILGHVGIMNDGPLRDREAFEALVGDCATRASAELLRLRRTAR